ncbi:hypothetical protein [Virgibacillus salexigens]|uniref:hypothetical protein n=1 Tax=Virgibacillus massiliensis TaxID=1462526 RepID=UPI00136E8F90|nr:hypothetical protein [Virgibacillus massiliensis]MYL43121.1 hypothetical protein [Virgibacillus massiliensis]
MERRTFGLISTGLFFVGLITYFVFLLGDDRFYVAGGIITFVGFILAFISDKGRHKWIGVIGNGIMVFMIFIFPFLVTTFFWNTP